VSECDFSPLVSSAMRGEATETKFGTGYSLVVEDDDRTSNSCVMRAYAEKVCDTTLDDER